MTVAANPQALVRTATGRRLRVWLSENAQQRYAQRVRPDLSAEAAAAELLKRAEAGRLTRYSPMWLGTLPRPRNASGFLVLAGEPKAALPLVRNSTGDVVATTTKTPPTARRDHGLDG